MLLNIIFNLADSMRLNRMASHCSWLHEVIALTGFQVPLFRMLCSKFTYQPHNKPMTKHWSHDGWESFVLSARPARSSS